MMNHHPPPAPPAMPPPMPPLPPGWVPASDPASGRTYYVNPTTGETSWEPPLPPPPPVNLPHPHPQGGGFQQQQQQQHFVPAQTATPQQHYAQQHPTTIPMGGAVGSPYQARLPHHPQQPQHPQQQQQYPPTGPTAIAAAPPPQALLIPPQPTPPVSNLGTASLSSLLAGTIPAATGVAGGLVPSVRSMIDAEYTDRTMNNNSNNKELAVELSDLTSGTLADLCNVTREVRRAEAAAYHNHRDDGEADDDDDGFVPYEPLEPYKLPVASKAPHIEPGRVDIRMVALYDKLGRI